MKFWHAVALVNANRIEESLPLFRDVFKSGDNWRILVRRLYNADILRNSEHTLDRILAISP